MTDPGSHQVGVAPDDGARGRLLRKRLEEDIRERDRTIARLQQRIDLLQNSARMRLGGLLVELARRPSNALRLPAELIRLRSRRSDADPDLTRDQSVYGSLRFPRSIEPQHADEATLLTGLRLPSGHGDLVVYGVMSTATAAALDDYVAVLTPAPHEATVLLEQTEPNLVLIQASALLPPALWAHAGTPGGAVDKARILHDVARRAHVRAIPIVVWLDVPRSRIPALEWLVRDADVVADAGDGVAWSPGVSLRRAYPGEGAVTDRVLIVADVAAPERHDRPWATVRPPWRSGLFEDIRRHTVLVVSPWDAGATDVTLAALACGARVVSGSADEALAAFGPAVIAVPDNHAVPDVAKAALALPALPVAEQRHSLRLVFDHHAVPVRLSTIAADLDLPYDLGKVRGLTAIVEPADAAGLRRALDSLLAQSVRPTELIIVATDVPDGAREAVDRAGVPHRVIAPAIPMSELPHAVTTPWATFWGAGDQHRDWLKDLLAAAESGRADAVGFDASVPGYGGHAPTLPRTGTVIRQELLYGLGGDSDLRQLGERGARLFAVNPSGAPL